VENKIIIEIMQAVETGVEKIAKNRKEKGMSKELIDFGKEYGYSVGCEVLEVIKKHIEVLK
jgi:hypothetical protein